MTGLLVSVRSASEARAALNGGADLIDVKEPLRGALGAAEPAVWREVAHEVAGAVPLSAALGELLADTQADEEEVRTLAPHYVYAKLGLAGCADFADWPRRWEVALRAIPASVSRVAVIYADWHTARSPPPDEVLNLGVALRCKALLLDTFDKSAGDLFCHLRAGNVRQLIAAARKAGLKVVLGGSLTIETLPQALSLSPDFVAVRGAACRNSRTGPVDIDLVRKLAESVRGASPGTPPRACLADPPPSKQQFA